MLRFSKFDLKTPLSRSWARCVDLNFNWTSRMAKQRGAAAGVKVHVKGMTVGVKAHVGGVGVLGAGRTSKARGVDLKL